MWFKKNAYILGYNSTIAADGTDWRTVRKDHNWPTSPTLPSAADAGNYFYLPALGHYNFDKLYVVGRYGLYWSSSPYSWPSNYAYYMEFHNGFATVRSGYRFYGYRVEPTFK